LRGSGSCSRCVNSEIPIGVVVPPESVFGDDPILGLAEDQSDAWFVIRVAKEIVNDCTVGIHLSCEFQFERGHLQIDDDIAAQLRVLEEQANTKIFFANFEWKLAAEKRETAAQFQEKLLYVLD